MQNSSRKLNSIHILVLVHNAMYMAHTTVRLVFNFSSFTSRPMKTEVWPIFKLQMSTADLHNIYSTIEIQFMKVLALCDLDMSNKIISKYVRRGNKRRWFIS